MAVWDSDYMIITLRDPDTGEYDTGTYTVEYQPVDQAYPAGAISATQLSTLYCYKPDSDGDTENAYDIHIDGTKIGRILGSDLLGLIGG